MDDAFATMEQNEMRNCSGDFTILAAILLAIWCDARHSV
jgi:hypothetical protein